MRSIGLACVMAAMVLGSVGPAVMADDQDSTQAAEVSNVLITFTVGRIDSGHDVPLKSYSLLAAGNGEKAEMMTGARVPIPVTRATADPAKPVTSFTYQNVGFTAVVEALVLPSGKIKLAGSIEDSSLAQPTHSGGGPIIQTLQQQLTAILDDGMPLRINSVEETETRSLYIEMKADVLDRAAPRVAKRNR